jgi:PAS domain S-box-containing protein
MLVGGFLGSLLLGWAVHLAQTARGQADELRVANWELKRQIAERLQAEDALREQETSYRTLTENLPGMVYRLFLRGGHRMQWFNSMSLPMTGFTVPDLTDGDRLSFGRLVLAEDRPKLRAALRQALRLKTPYKLEYRIHHKNGDVRYFHERGAPVCGPDGRVEFLDGVIIDVTEHRRLEQGLQRSEATLKALSAKLLTVQEKERQRIARELHDGIGQSLTSIKFLVENTLTAVRNRVSKKGLRFLQQAITMVQTTVEEVRSISMDLRPSMLDDLGILPTLSWLCRQFRAAHLGIVVETDIQVAEADIPGALKTSIFRIVQEAMNNVAKHASADRVRISLTRLDGRLELVVEDNGRGFDPEALASEDGARSGFGLASMRERAELSSGTFRIESRRGGGTAAQVAWPVPEVQEAPATAL